jgi:Flp pilus assembly protein TadD
MAHKEVFLTTDGRLRRPRRTLPLLALALLTSLVFSRQAGQHGETSGEEARASVELPERLTRLDPTFRFELEQALQRADYERAELLLVREIETNPNAPQHELLLYLGGLFFVNQKYLNAAVAFKKAEALFPLDNGNRFTLAMSYVLLGRRDWAREELKRLAELEPENALYPYWLARLDYDDNNYAACVEKLEKSLEAFPDDVRQHDRMGLCLEALGRNDEAVESYRRAIELNRQSGKPSSWPPMNLGILLTQLGRFDEAETTLAEAVQADPAFAQAHYRLGIALEKLERYDEALTALREAASLDPGYPDPHWALSRVLRLTGDREGARAAVDEYQRLKKAQETP